MFLCLFITLSFSTSGGIKFLTIVQTLTVIRYRNGGKNCLYSGGLDQFNTKVTYKFGNNFDEPKF